MESHSLIIKNKNNNNIAITVYWMLTMCICEVLSMDYLDPVAASLEGQGGGKGGCALIPSGAAAQGDLASKPNFKPRRLGSKSRT